MRSAAPTTTHSPLIFTSRQVAFGRAQTFPLRLGWLPKLRAFLDKYAESGKDEDLSDDNMMSELGVGKNMITSIKHWARAADVINDGLALTNFGKQLFAADGFDPYLEDEATLWLLHWKITSRPRYFTAGYFLFNHCFILDDFTADQLLDDIVGKVEGAGATGGRGSIKSDINTALNMYAARYGKQNEGDESVESPFPLLGLIRTTAPSRYIFSVEPRESLPAEVVGYAANEILQATNSDVLNLEFSAARNVAGNQVKVSSLAGVFRITEDSLLQKLEDFCARFPAYVLRESAGGWQLFINGKPPTSAQLLKAVYTEPGKKSAGRRTANPMLIDPSERRDH